MKDFYITYNLEQDFDNPRNNTDYKSWCARGYEKAKEIIQSNTEK